MTSRTPSVAELYQRWLHSPGATPEEICEEFPEVIAELKACINRAGGGLHGKDEGPDDEGDEDESVAPSIHELPIIEGFRLVKKLGEGGQGAVFKAIQLSPRRKVAIKVLLASPYSSKSATHRFEREIEIVATLRHPQIVAVFDSGKTSDGHPFFAMDYIHGLPFTEYVRRTQLNLEQALDLFVTACDAVNHAHQKGVMHRDLKPANILVDGQGHLHILDFGLAKQMAEPVESLVSETGQILGTLRYMSPEQIKGHSDLLDIRTDVYALGIILYELLTGTYPYPVFGATATILGHIAHTEPKPLSKSWTEGMGIAASTRHRSSWHRGSRSCPIDDEIATVALKAIAKERERRYQSAGELARDVQHYLRNEPIEAKRDSGVYLLKRALRKYRLSVGVVALFMLLLIVSTVVSWSLRNEAVRQLANAQASAISEHHARVETETALHSANDRLVMGLSYRGSRLLAADKPAEAREALYEGLKLLSKTDMPSAWLTVPLAHAAWAFPTSLYTTFVDSAAADSTGVQRVVISPDGQSVLSRDAHNLTLWSLQTGQIIRTFPNDGLGCGNISFSPNGRNIMSGNRDNSIRVWDLEGGQLVASHVRSNLNPQLAEPMSLSFSQHGRLAVWATKDRFIGRVNLELHDVPNNQLVRTFAGDPGEVMDLAFSSDDRFVASASGGKAPYNLKLWDVETGRELRTFSGHSGEVQSIAFSRDNSVLYSGAFDKTIRVWQVDTGKELRTIPLGDNVIGIKSIVVTADGRFLLAGCLDGVVRMVDLLTGRQVRSFFGHKDWVSSVAVTFDGHFALSGGSDGAIKLWDLRNDGASWVSPDTGAGIMNVAFDADGRLAFTEDRQGAIIVWDTEVGKEIRRFSGAPGRVGVLSPNGHFLLAATGDKAFALVSMETGETVRTLAPSSGELRTVALTSNGQFAISADSKDRIERWDLSTGTVLHSIPNLGPVSPALNNMGAIAPRSERGMSPHQITISPDDQFVLEASGDEHGGRPELWDIEGHGIPTDSSEQKRAPKSNSPVPSGLPIGLSLQFSGHDSGFTCLAFSPDGRFALAGGHDRNVRLWDIKTGKLTCTFVGHNESIFSVAVTADDRTVFSTAGDNCLLVWDVSTGKQIHVMSTSSHCVTYSPTNQKLLFDHNNNIICLDLTTDVQQREIESLLPASRLALDKNPSDAEALLAFGRWYAIRGVNDWAANMLERSRKAGGIVSPLLLGQCYWKLDRFEDALVEYQKALAQKEAPDFYLHLCIEALKRENASATQPNLPNK